MGGLGTRAMQCGDQYNNYLGSWVGGNSDFSLFTTCFCFLGRGSSSSDSSSSSSGFFSRSITSSFRPRPPTVPLVRAATIAATCASQCARTSGDDSTAHKGAA